MSVAPPPPMHPTVMRRFLLALLTLPALLGAQQDFSTVKVTVVPVTTNLYMLQGSGGNIGLSVRADDAFLIDDQYAPLAPRIREAIAAVTAKPARFLVNTRWHGDHTGGNANMASAGSILVAHENVRRRMSTEQFLEAFEQRVADFDATWGKGFLTPEQFLTIAYASVTGDTKPDTKARHGH